MESLTAVRLLGSKFYFFSPPQVSAASLLYSKKKFEEPCRHPKIILASNRLQTFSMRQKRRQQETTTTTVPTAITKTLSMRDLYNRPNKLQYWLGRIETDLEGSDREDVLKLVHDMEDKESAALWIVRCITALITMRKQLKKTFKDAPMEDICPLLRWMDANYKPASNGKFRQILKLFYKVVYGNGTEYPDKVKWFSSKLSKEKRSETTSTDLAKYLEEDEVKRLIEAGSTVQRKAFLACLYESGARPEEFLRLTLSL